MAAAGVNWTVSQTFDEGPQALLEAVKLAQSLGNDVNAANDMGITALHGAANRGSDDIIRFLVEKGASLDRADGQGRTAMTWARGRVPRDPSARSEAQDDRFARTTTRQLIDRRFDFLFRGTT